MSKSSRWARFGWMLPVLLAGAFALWMDAVRVNRVRYVSSIGQPPAPASATWRPSLAIPEHDNVSYEWLAQTRLMFARQEWRVRSVDYENAPIGHEIEAASPYRWWLGGLAWIDHHISGRSIGAAIERIALFADPLLRLILLVTLTVVVAWQFGGAVAAVAALAVATFFPLGVNFLPGAPSEIPLVQLWVLWSVLPLLLGIRSAYSSTPKASITAARWFFLAGIAGGVGAWIDVAVQLPVLAGIAVGAWFAAFVARGKSPASNQDRPALPWPLWGAAGAATIGIGHFVEYFPAHLGEWQFRSVHPLYGVAWIGLGILLDRTTSLIRCGRSRWAAREWVVLIVGVLALVALPWVMWRKHTWGFLDVDVAAFRLTRLARDIPTTGVLAWLLRDGVNPRFWATLCPLAVVFPAGWWLILRSGPVALRMCLALALGPVLVATGFACKQLSWWSTMDILLVPLLIAVVAVFFTIGHGKGARWLCSAGLTLLLGIGAMQNFPAAEVRGQAPLTEADTLTLVERDLARWLSLHIGSRDAVVLSPHNQGITLYYYGGLRGLATLTKENVDGLGVAVRILSASTPEEARELIDSRGVTHIVVPSWDAYFETYTRMGMGKVEGTFFERLLYWRLPPWLKPVPYQLPTISGFEGNTVTIFEVVEDQEDAASLSRIAEYFLEVQQLERAVNTALLLRRFPADLGALTARAQVEFAQGNQESLAKTLESVQRRVASGSDRTLAWDRRVSLAVVLAQAKLTDLARDRVRRCMMEATEARIRSLTTGQLYRLLVLARAYNLEFKESALTALALSLVPDDMRARVEPRGLPVSK